tara:strand:+ start:1008 stop:1274 length:267 start_codon:yes stop_codon:yes gene_type:complete
MAKKKVNPVQMYAEQTTGVRLSSHEKLCAERMKTLFNKIDDMNKDIKNLSYDINLLKEYANKSKGGFKLLMILGSVLAAALGFFKYNG